MLLKFAQRRLGEIEERLVVRAQRVGRDAREDLAEPCVGLLQDRRAVGGYLALSLELGSQPRQGYCTVRRLARGPCPRDGPPGYRADHESDGQNEKDGR